MVRISKKIQKNINYELIVISLFSILPLIDSCNGYLEGTIAIGSMYKLILLVVILFPIVISKKRFSKSLLLVVVCAIGYIFFSVVSNVIFFNGTIISNDYLTKLIFNILLYGLFSQNMRERIISGDTIFKILDNSSWIMVCCLLIPYVLGVGNRVYANQIGYKGFFISQNELSFVLIVLCFFSSFKLLCKITMTGIIQLTLLVICAMLINTKSTIFAGLIAVCLMIIFKVIHGNMRSKLITSIIAVLGGVVLRNVIFSSIQSMLSRYGTLKNVYYNNSIFTAILSGRNIYFQFAWKYLTENHSIFRFIFGNGFCSSYLIEMDFIDIFFYFGLLGVLALIVFLAIIFRKIMKSYRNENRLYRIISYLVVIGFMFFTGHVIFMAMSGTYFIIYIIFLMTYKFDEKEMLADKGELYDKLSSNVSV